MAVCSLPRCAPTLLRRRSPCPPACIARRLYHPPSTANINLPKRPPSRAISLDATDLLCSLRPPGQRASARRELLAVRDAILAEEAPKLNVSLSRVAVIEAAAKAKRDKADALRVMLRSWSSLPLELRYLVLEAAVGPAPRAHLQLGDFDQAIRSRNEILATLRLVCSHFGVRGRST